MDILTSFGIWVKRYPSLGGGSWWFLLPEHSVAVEIGNGTGISWVGAEVAHCTIAPDHPAGAEKQQYLSLFAGAHAPLIRHDNYQLFCQQQHSAGISYFDGPEEGQHPVRQRALAASPSTTPAACLWAFAASKHQWCACTIEGGAERAGARRDGSSWEVLLGFEGRRCAWVKEELVVLFHNDQATGEGAGGAEC